MTKLAKGLDVGTGNLVAAVKDEAGNTKYKTQRNVFIEIESADAHTTTMLDQSGINWVKQDDKMYILGDHAHNFSKVFGEAPQRPMKAGVISPSEADAIPIMKLMLEKLVGQGQAGEEIVFSVPAEPVDQDFDAVFHEAVFTEILTELGYKPRAIPEGHAVVFADMAKEEFTGIGISFGAGMSNVCVSYRTLPAAKFSVARGGDWIDHKSAAVTGQSIPEVQTIKESMDLARPETREEKAIATYYRALISHTLEHIVLKFATTNIPKFDKPIPIVCAGGTASVKGFMTMFREEFGRIKFPVDVDPNGVRVAEEPLYSVAKGALISALAN